MATFAAALCLAVPVAAEPGSVVLHDSLDGPDFVESGGLYYRENYERMGFPSPEELDRQRDQDMKARLELAEQLRQARLEKERLELEQRELDLESARPEIDAIDDSGVYWNGFGGFYTGGFDRFGNGRFRNRSRFRDGGYRATPFGIIPTPRAPRPQRIISNRGRRGGVFIRGRR